MGVYIDMEMPKSCAKCKLLGEYGCPFIRDEILYLCDSIDKGYVSYADIRRALREEHGTEVVFE